MKLVLKMQVLEHSYFFYRVYNTDLYILGGGEGLKVRRKITPEKNVRDVIPQVTSWYRSDYKIWEKCYKVGREAKYLSYLS